MSNVNVSVLWLFLMVLFVGLRCVIVVFPDHTHLLFYGYSIIYSLVYGLTANLFFKENNFHFLC